MLTLDHLTIIAPSLSEGVSHVQECLGLDVPFGTRHASLGRIIVYTKKVDAMISFYCKYFHYEVHRGEGDRIVELQPQGPGISLLLHPASKGQKEGQSLIKLVFDVPDVDTFCEHAKKRDLEFGSVQQADGYRFANAKDPSNNPISVSSRIYAE